MFYGSIVALVTPMDEYGDIDYAALRRLVDFHIESGSNGIVVAGTTGESATLSSEEYKRLLKHVVAQVDSRIQVLAGSGSADTRVAITQTRHAAEAGVDGVLVVTPYYNHPMPSGLLAHYNALADVTEVPIVLYNVPSRTAVDMLPDTVAELAQRDEIVAIKEAVPDMDRIRVLTKLCGESLVVLSGDDSSCLAAMRAGAKGVVSVAANVVPGLFRDLCDNAAGGDWQAAVEIDEKLRHLYKLLALETNPIPVKWALHKMALTAAGIRLPLLPLDRRHHQTILLGLNDLGLA